MPAVRSRSERLREAAALSVVGGFLDAYVYLTHGGVFANAQTGNVVLFGVDAAHGHWPSAVRHVPPVIAFVVGIATVEALARLRHVRVFARPARWVLLAECVAFTVIGSVSLPATAATVLIAWVATLQVGTFRHVGDSSYNATFTTGNLRTLVTDSVAWLADRDYAAKRRALVIGLVVASFAGGAVLGGLAVRWLHDHAVLLTVPVLLAVFAGIVRDTTRLSAEPR